uniref:DRBM domain-containing protein n=1 Tax=Timema bartmani TaxID=61472 RepID=A0A7R9FAL6_9NEOP|nr:unnamed protein product [Timema bartmani]
MSFLLLSGSDPRNFVGRLQHLCVKLGAHPPKYSVLADTGADKHGRYSVNCSALGFNAVGVELVSLACEVLSEPAFTWRESGKHFRKPTPSSPERDSYLDLPILGSQAQHETSALTNYTTEAGGARRKKRAKQIAAEKILGLYNN